LEDTKLRDWLVPPEPRESNWFQKRGRVFERILTSMLSKEEMEPHTSMRPSGEEIDGSFAVGDNFYLLEAKWHAEPIPASSLYSFRGKLEGKITGTIGVFFSMSDYSRDAPDALLRGKQLNMILFSHSDLLLIEDGKITMREAMRAKRRYAADYGSPFYPLNANLPELKKPMLGGAGQVQLEQWIILVEGEDDERTIRALLNRFKITVQYNVIPAGGQLTIAKLAEYLISINNINVAAIVTPLSKQNIQQEGPINKLHEIGVELIVLNQNIEYWLESYVSTEYYNATSGLTNRNGKMARRYARNADLEKLLSENPSFSALISKLGIQPKS
jgi:hypothetical protein